jgi:hypothetical protein
MESDSDEELEPRVKYSFIVQEEDYETEDEEDSNESVKPWDPSEIFFRIR